MITSGGNVFGINVNAVLSFMVKESGALFGNVLKCKNNENNYNNNNTHYLLRRFF